MLRELKIPDACFCLRALVRRCSVGRAQHRQEHKKQDAQSLEGDEAGNGLEHDRHVAEFSCLLPGQLKGKRYSFGPRPRRAPQTEWISTTFCSRLRK